MEAKQKCIQVRLRHKPYLYFSAAKASGFTEMFMVSQKLKDVEEGAQNDNFYPKEGPCPVETLSGKYTEDGCNMVDGDEKTSVWGMNWFFCDPKQEIDKKCTIL